MARIVIFGDSNEAVFGPPVMAWYVQHAGVPPNEVKFTFQGSSFAQWAPGGSLWPKIASALQAETQAVVIGLGGNMQSSLTAHHKFIKTLVDALAKHAPNARLIWRGPPPATAKKAGINIAPLKEKRLRYRKNKVLKYYLDLLEFKVLKASTLDVHAAPRIYVDVIDMHAGGPAPGAGGTPLQVGTPACLAYEHKVIASGGAELASESPSAGPWKTYVRSKDDMYVHVPVFAAEDLVVNHLAPRKLYTL